MYKHILCPTDLGERSYIALEKATQIAHQFDAKITMLNVHKEFLDHEERRMLRVSVDSMKEKFKQTALDCKEKMKKRIKNLNAEDIEIEYLLREGKPEKEIVAVADEIDVELIVIATDGRDNLKDFVTGTITEHVINHVACPVLVIPCDYEKEK